MKQRGITPILIIILIASIIGGYLYFQKQSRRVTIPVHQTTQEFPSAQQTSIPTSTPSSTVTPSPSPTTPTVTPTSQKTIHLYPALGADPNISISKLNIIGVMFIPKNITTEIKPLWLTNMDKVFSQIKQFYEKQFNNQIQVTYQVIDEPVKGDLNIEDYYPSDLATETQKKKSNMLKPGTYNIWMIYLVRDPDYKLNLKGGNLGGLPTLNAATQFEYSLDDEAITNSYGIITSAHEFGHALGIPHPWEDPSLKSSGETNFGALPGNIMGYNYNVGEPRGVSRSLMEGYIMLEQKQKMGFVQ